MLVVVVAAFAAVGALTALGTFVTTPGTFGLGSFATPAFASYGDSQHDRQQLVTTPIFFENPQEIVFCCKFSS